MISYSSPTVTKRITTTKEYNEAGQVVKEITVEEDLSYPYTYNPGVVYSNEVGKISYNG